MISHGVMVCRYVIQSCVAQGHHFMHTVTSVVVPPCAHCNNTVWNVFSFSFHCSCMSLSALLMFFCIRWPVLPCRCSIFDEYL